MVHMKEYGHLDYSIPTIDMLKALVYEFKPFRTNTIWAILFGLFIDLSMIFHFSGRLDLLHTEMLFSTIFVGAVIIGLII